MKPVAAGVAIALCALSVACSKQQQPKVDAATEQKEAHDRAVQGPFSAQVQGLDKAKALQQDANKMAEERGAAADSMSK